MPRRIPGWDYESLEELAADHSLGHAGLPRLGDHVYLVGAVKMELRGAHARLVPNLCAHLAIIFSKMHFS
jgi:hypothetical protein